MALFYFNVCRLCTSSTRSTCLHRLLNELRTAALGNDSVSAGTNGGTRNGDHSEQQPRQFFFVASRAHALQKVTFCNRVPIYKEEDRQARRSDALSCPGPSNNLQSAFWSTLIRDRHQGPSREEPLDSRNEHARIA